MAGNNTIAPRSITSANASIILTVPGLYEPGVSLQGFMADNIFSTASVAAVETVMGADGILSGGWIPRTTKFTINIMPNSPSSVIFEDWVAAQDGQTDVYPCSMIVTLSSTGRVYTCSNGYISELEPVPGAKKVLEGRAFVIVFNSVVAAPTGQ